MSSYDLVILLRSDGTFCEELEEPDWQTKITGRYKKIKEGYFLEYMDSSVENDTITIEEDKEGYTSIYYGGTQMVKMDVANKVPSGFYKYSSASSSGGMGTGLIYVGTQRFEGYNFYDNGTFDRNSTGGVMVSGGGDGGGGIGGGSNSESSSSGKYTIKNGLLTLFNRDGSIEKHSFFYDADGGEDFMVALDGSIFFYEENEQLKSGEIHKNPDPVQPKIEPSTSDVTSAINVLQSVKTTHGGQAIDALKTLKAEVVISGMNFKVLLDNERHYIRLESLEPSFPYIEQLEGNSGWTYQNNSYNEMPAERINEMKLTFISGILGLQKKVLDKTKILETLEGGENLNLISAQISNEKTGYIINTLNNSLSATIIIKEDQKEVTYLSDFKMVGDLFLPYKETTVTNETTIEVFYKSYILNPTFTVAEWSKKR
ncbi:hypothetical protein A9200_02105 [Maribacter hydrothermalis]|uniref:Uncharacterized protein n=2 Tax=Maribacter hydrothermalis TaxID=1836467 RepID=A0A1B7ZF91_9FLAO|nr:hypothetical protein BTR34_10480 [Maribacter hydrothermalis]OBR42203.1 hypothetical protein A9200_02105 [Maribacter hydrothermalis]